MMIICQHERLFIMKVCSVSSYMMVHHKSHTSRCHSFIDQLYHRLLICYTSTSLPLFHTLPPPSFPLPLPPSSSLNITHAAFSTSSALTSTPAPSSPPSRCRNESHRSSKLRYSFIEYLIIRCHPSDPAAAFDFLDPRSAAVDLVSVVFAVLLRLDEGWSWSDSTSDSGSVDGSPSKCSHRNSSSEKNGTLTGSKHESINEAVAGPTPCSLVSTSRVLMMPSCPCRRFLVPRL